MRPISCLLSMVLVALLVSIGHAQTDIFFDGGPFYNEVIFDQNFTKGQGPFNQTVIINNPGDTVRIFLRNGGPFPAQGVSNGSVTLNGQVLFNANDFKIEDGDLFAVVTKEIALLNGANTLDVQLKGGGTGTVNVRILRAMSFPAGTVFVAPGGADSGSCGAQGSPCATIAQGIVRAVATTGPQVLVANGVYVENVTLVPGIDVLGGFSTNFSTRDVQGTGTVIHGSGSSPTVVANSITSATLFEGFIVHGPTVTTAGGNSVAVSIDGSTNALQVQSNVIVGGVAGDGAGGGDGTPGTPGGNGTAGGNSQNTATTISGGAGGTGVGGDGGDGGTSTAPAFEAQNGSGNNGLTSAGGSGGAGGFNGRLDGLGCIYTLPASGVDASPSLPGGPGTPGVFGPGGLASSGSGTTGTWVSASGGVGNAGTPGSGGGGGGAGGGGATGTSTTCVSAVVTGPSGGGGGAGGAGGTEGAGGQGGGGVFNIFVFNGDPTISGNRIFLGTAGNGGLGGQGRKGGSGGQGGAAGVCVVFGCGVAGSGGDGGNGGHGSGGGGAGGPSVGIYSNFMGGYGAANTIETSTGVAGVGGAGGQSLGNDGQAGESDSVLAILEQ